MVLVREIGPEDWRLVRDIRLAALGDAPKAFGSSYEREIAFGEADWRRRFSPRSVTFVAYLPEVGPAGMAGGLGDQERVVELVSMWVAPTARGHRVGEALVNAVTGWATGRGVHLWVTEGNTTARALYERCGFISTTERQQLPSDSSLSEVGMLRPA
jgi:GNAT superfamily N-acetyltransferase